MTTHPIDPVTKSESNVPAILLGSSYTVLGTARTLGRAGIQAYCLSDNLKYLGHSRYCHMLDKVRRIPEFSSLAAILPEIPFEHAVLFPCSDHWTLEIARLDGRFRDRFSCIISPVSTIETLLNKGKLALKLKELSFPAPLTLKMNSEEDLERWPEDRWPISFLKPCDSQKFMSIFYRKAIRISSKEEARHWMRKIMAVGVDVVLQEYVPGPATRHYFVDGYVDSKGELRALFARQRLRMYPLDFGDSSALRSITLDALGTLPERLADLLKQLSYRGIFSAEFKFDERDKEYKLLEINARPWWYIAYAADCGVDVATMAYRDALGQDVPTVRSYRVGVGLVSLTNDKKASWALFKKGKLPFFPWLWSWLTYSKAVFNWDDPSPTLALTLQRIKLHFGRLMGNKPTRP